MFGKLGNRKQQEMRGDGWEIVFNSQVDGFS